MPIPRQGKMLFALLILAVGQAAAGGADFDLELGGGYRYDSNVGIPDIDTSSGRGDQAALLDFAVTASLPLANELGFVADYAYTSVAYQQLSDYDFNMHRLQAAAQLRAPGFTARLTAAQYLAAVGGEDYLQLRQVSPSVSRLLGSSLFVRGAYTRGNRQYPDQPGRDADTDGLRADAYLLLDGMQRYLATHLELVAENAAEDQYDQTGLATGLDYGHRLRWAGRSVDLKVGLNWERRAYDAVSGAVGDARQDRLLGASLRATVPLADWLSLEGDVEYLDRQSNSKSNDYAEGIVSLRLSASF